MMPIIVEKLFENPKSEKKAAPNDKISKEKCQIVYFHGKDIRTKKFQKHINRKSKLYKVILVNSVIIASLILITWMFIVGL
ncbi:MAG: hypothetical protein ACFE8M_08400 [Candidatus Hermodarchaeota archaeon]